jgi:peptidoglycan/LPS O-acetylase OafA/YrhL
MTETKSHFLPLTSIRFFAGMWVVVHHFGKPLIPYGNRFLERLIERGHVGVTMFFVLSGFVLTLNYAERSRVEPRAFYFARIARIYPLYLVALLLATPLFILYNSHTTWLDLTSIGWQLLLCLFSMQAWFPNQSIAVNPPGWSLSAEAFFYLSFPLLMNQRIVRRMLSKPMLAILGLWTIGLAITAFFQWMYPGVAVGNHLDSTTEVEIKVLAFNPLLRLPEFLIGCATGMLYTQGKVRIGKPALISAISIGIIGLVVGFTPRGNADNFLSGSLLAPLFGAFLLSLACLPSDQTGFLSAGWLVFLGEASYGLYILHVPIHQWLEFILRRTRLVFDPGIETILFLSICLTSAGLTYRFFEVPARRWLRSRFGA